MRCENRSGNENIESMVSDPLELWIYGSFCDQRIYYCGIVPVSDRGGFADLGFQSGSRFGALRFFFAEVAHEENVDYTSWRCCCVYFWEVEKVSFWRMISMILLLFLNLVCFCILWWWSRVRYSGSCVDHFFIMFKWRRSCFLVRDHDVGSAEMI